MSITVYGFWRSIASFRVRVALRLKGLPFEEIPIDILSGEQFEPGYAAVNAERVVPTFIHDGHSVFQSLAIIEYLDEIQPTPRLIPQDAKERAYARCLALMPRRSRTGAHIGRRKDSRPMNGCSRAARRLPLHWVANRASPISASLARWSARSILSLNWALFPPWHVSPNAALLCRRLRRRIRSSSRDIRRPARRTDGRFQTSRPSTLAALPPAIWANVASSIPCTPATCPIGLYSAMSNG